MITLPEAPSPLDKCVAQEPSVVREPLLLWSSSKHCEVSGGELEPITFGTKAGLGFRIILVSPACDHDGCTDSVLMPLMRFAEAKANSNKALKDANFRSSSFSGLNGGTLSPHRTMARSHGVSATSVHRTNTLRLSEKAGRQHTVLVTDSPGKQVLSLGRIDRNVEICIF